MLDQQLSLFIFPWNSIFLTASNDEWDVIFFRCHKYMWTRWKKEYYKLQQRFESSVDQLRPSLYTLVPSWMSESIFLLVYELGICIRIINNLINNNSHISNRSASSGWWVGQCNLNILWLMITLVLSTRCNQSIGYANFSVD